MSYFDDMLSSRTVEYGKSYATKSSCINCGKTNVIATEIIQSAPPSQKGTKVGENYHCQSCYIQWKVRKNGITRPAIFARGASDDESKKYTKAILETIKVEFKNRADRYKKESEKGEKIGDVTEAYRIGYKEAFSEIREYLDKFFRDASSRQDLHDKTIDRVWWEHAQEEERTSSITPKYYSWRNNYYMAGKEDVYKLFGDGIISDIAGFIS